MSINIAAFKNIMTFNNNIVKFNLATIVWKTSYKRNTFVWKIVLLQYCISEQLSWLICKTFSFHLSFIPLLVLYFLQIIFEIGVRCSKTLVTLETKDAIQKTNIYLKANCQSILQLAMIIVAKSKSRYKNPHVYVVITKWLQS